jgi:uncharacterized protein (TIGR00730 family)
VLNKILIMKDHCHKYVVGVVVIIEKGGKLLALRRTKKEEASPGVWENIAGKVESDEDLLGAVHREIKEESGLNAEVDPVSLGIIRTKRNDDDMFLICYRAKYLSGEVKLSEEHSEYTWFTPEEFCNKTVFKNLAEIVRNNFKIKNRSVKNICVFSSSSDAIPKVFFEATRELGKLIVQNDYNLVFGGAEVGLMGEIAKSVHDYNGHVIGVIPEKLNRAGITYKKNDVLIITKDMRERKAFIEENSDAFIALPGGFGTLEELTEIITLKQLGYHNKAIVILNIENYYSSLLNTFEHIYEYKFAKSEYKQLYFVAADASSAMEYIKNYKPSDQGVKWF